jgi:hypothetical protein
MLQISLERGHAALVEQFMGNRDTNEKSNYVVVAANYFTIVLLRWLLENGPPIDAPLAFKLKTDRLVAFRIEFTGYLSEDDRVQLVRKFVRDSWRGQLLWILENTKFNDSSRAIITKAIKRAPSDTVQNERRDS